MDGSEPTVTVKVKLSSGSRWSTRWFVEFTRSHPAHSSDVNAPIPVTYIELSTEHRYIMDEELKECYSVAKNSYPPVK